LGQARERHDCIINRGAYPRRNSIASLMAKIDRPSPIESPCNKVCVVDAACGLCIGCGRSLAEIGGWITMTADERRRIMAELPARRAALPRTGTT